MTVCENHSLTISFADYTFYHKYNSPFLLLRLQNQARVIELHRQQTFAIFQKETSTGFGVHVLSRCLELP